MKSVSLFLCSVAFLAVQPLFAETQRNVDPQAKAEICYSLRDSSGFKRPDKVQEELLGKLHSVENGKKVNICIVGIGNKVQELQLTQNDVDTYLNKYTVTLRSLISGLPPFGGYGMKGAYGPGLPPISTWGELEHHGLDAPNASN